MFLAHGLRRCLWVDAGGTEEEQLAYTVAPGRLDDVVLDEQILQEEVDGIVAVGENAAYFGRGQEDVLRLYGGEKCLHCAAVCQVELGPRARNDILITFLL